MTKIDEQRFSTTANSAPMPWIHADDRSVEHFRATDGRLALRAVTAGEKEPDGCEHLAAAITQVR